MKSFPVASFLAFFLFYLAMSPVRAANPGGETLLVTPFVNQSKAPGIEWIGESFPELFGERLSSPTLYLPGREERLRVYDRAGIPAEGDASRVVLYRIAEQMDVDYVLFGNYSFDGRVFTASAQLLDMRRLRLLPEARESGPLLELIRIQTALAWDTLRILGEEPPSSRDAYVAAATPIRLDAFENCVRGVIASNPVDRIRYFREAVRRDPDYRTAWLHLGKALYRQAQYDVAISALAHVPQGSPSFEEASFYLGLAAFFENDFPRSETAFTQVEARMPLPEVYNNLGVVAARQAKAAAVEFFRKAADSDPDDETFRFNLAVSLCRNRDWPSATRELRQAAALAPNDSEGKKLLDAIAASAPPPAAGAAAVPPEELPRERIRTDYSEGSFRQLALEIDAAAEQRLAKADPRKHAQFHLERGQELLARGFLGEAEREFRDSVAIDPGAAEAHVGLARVLEASHDDAGARSEAEAALRQRQFAEPFLILARLDLRDNRVDRASQNVTEALRLEPANNAAQALERTIAARLAEKARPLPKP